MTIIELAAALIAVAFAVLVAYLVPTLVQLRRTVAESAQLLTQTNKELPSLITEMRAMTATVSELAEQTRAGVEHAAGFLHAVGEVGDTVQQVHAAVRGKSGKLFVNLASVVAGLKAASAVIKEREGFQRGREESNGDR
jgi:uncharacterized protein YoxC